VGTPDSPSECETSIQQVDNATQTSERKDSAEGPSYPGFGKFHRVLACNFTRGLVSKGNIVPLVIGSAGALCVLPFDQDISDAMSGSAPAWGDIGYVIGGQAVILGATGTMLAVTPFVKSERFRGFSFTLAQAMILDNVLTISLKAAVSRTRPDGANDYSFPSGHASNAFALSTVAANYYGWKVGVPAYAFAVFVALSRVERGAHYLSDVIAGSTVGFISGITAVRGSGHYAAGKMQKWTLAPSFGRRHMALCFSMNF
jgi:membrane-associated phospholipid phosphatase